MLGTAMLELISLLHIDVAPVGHLDLPLQLHDLSKGGIVLIVQPHGGGGKGRDLPIGPVLDQAACVG